MESSIPNSAVALLDLIGNTEAPKGYDTLFGNNQKNWPKKLTSMTVAEVIEAGPIWTKKFHSSAAGRYQFMNATLKSLRNSEALSGKEKFDPELQDRLAYALLDRRGYEEFAAGKLSIVAFGLALAQEWASFPVLEDCQGAHRKVKRGETYYAGDHLNKALISPETVEAILAVHPSSVVLAAFNQAKLQSWAGIAGDAEKIAKLVDIASDPQQCAKIRGKAKKAMIAIYGEATSHNACAATLCCFLQAADIKFPIEYGAGALAKYLEKNRGWVRIDVGNQKAGDVAVCYDNTSPHGADHIYLVVKRVDDDEMLIADNQTEYCPRKRFASGGGQTPVEYFLRASEAVGMKMMLAQGTNPSAFVAGALNDEIAFTDEDTNDLVIRFDADGKQLK